MEQTILELTFVEFSVDKFQHPVPSHLVVLVVALEDDSRLVETGACALKSHLIVYMAVPNLSSFLCKDSDFLAHIMFLSACDVSRNCRKALLQIKSALILI